MLDDIQSLKSSLAFILLPHEKQSQANTKIFGKMVI
jgi:hypothetical protein